MRVIIAGSRGFNDYHLLCKECDNILVSYQDKEIIIISGTAKGADQMGERYARDRNYGLVKFPADWDGLGRRAGYVRNENMAVYAKQDDGILIAFWDGKSKGTKHMIEIAKMCYLTGYLIEYNKK